MMKKYKIGEHVIFTIHKTKYPAIILNIDNVELLYKIHNTDNDSIYWVEAARISRKE